MAANKILKFICRSLRYGHSIRTHTNNPPSELPLPQTSTLRSRRRLANMLVAGSLVFVLCWTPHVICLVCSKFSTSEWCSKTVSDYYLLLGKCSSSSPTSSSSSRLWNANNIPESTRYDATCPLSVFKIN